MKILNNRNIQVIVMDSRIGDLILKTNPIVPKTFLISFSLYLIHVLNFIWKNVAALKKWFCAKPGQKHHRTQWLHLFQTIEQT